MEPISSEKITRKSKSVKPVKLQYIPVKLVEYMELLTSDISGTMEYRNIIFCGDRHYKDYKTILHVMESIHIFFHGINVVEGEAHGADLLCRYAAQMLNESGMGHWTIHPHTITDEMWKKLGKKAGPMRNADMLATKPFMVIAFHDYFEESLGTMDMVVRSLKAKVPVILIRKSAGSSEIIAQEVRLSD